MILSLFDDVVRQEDMMNKRIIWLIIGLMSAALIGSMWLQVNWIQSSIRLNEEQFNKNVFAALNAVAERLEYQEQREAFNYMNGYSTTYFEREVRQKLEDGKVQFSFDISYEQYRNPQVNQGKKDPTLVLSPEGDCQCEKCVSERMTKYSKLMRFNEQINHQTHCFIMIFT